jgi:hypothetical protein
VSEHESRLVLAVQIAAQLKRRNALRAVHEYDNRCEQISEAELA